MKSVFICLCLYMEIISIIWLNKYRCFSFLKKYIFKTKQRLSQTGPPDEGLEPATLRLKVCCSTEWANRPDIEWNLKIFLQTIIDKGIDTNYMLWSFQYPTYQVDTICYKTKMLIEMWLIKVNVLFVSFLYFP